MANLDFVFYGTDLLHDRLYCNFTNLHSKQPVYPKRLMREPISSSFKYKPQGEGEILHRIC